MIKYCLPIIEDSKEKILAKISENPGFDFYEVWLAYIKDLDTDFVWKISEQFNGKLVFLFRKQNLEKSDLEKEIKEKIIRLLENSDNLLDLDINDQKQELDFIKNNKLSNKLVVSYHDYKQTPELAPVVENMKLYNPEIFKVSTFCEQEEDGLKLLNLLLGLRKQGKKFIVSGMGEQGKIVRIYGALWGNEFNFSPISEDEKSAPGQLTRDKLEHILKELDPATSAG